MRFLPRFCGAQCLRSAATPTTALQTAGPHRRGRRPGTAGTGGRPLLKTLCLADARTVGIPPPGREPDFVHRILRQEGSRPSEGHVLVGSRYTLPVTVGKDSARSDRWQGEPGTGATGRPSQPPPTHQVPSAPVGRSSRSSGCAGTRRGPPESLRVPAALGRGVWSQRSAPLPLALPPSPPPPPLALCEGALGCFYLRAALSCGSECWVSRHVCACVLCVHRRGRRGEGGQRKKTDSRGSGRICKNTARSLRAHGVKN